jgi:hypothetical protein
MLVAAYGVRPRGRSFWLTIRTTTLSLVRVTNNPKLNPGHYMGRGSRKARPEWSESSARLHLLLTVSGRALVQNTRFSVFSEATPS